MQTKSPERFRLCYAALQDKEGGVPVIECDPTGACLSATGRTEPVHVDRRGLTRVGAFNCLQARTLVSTFSGSDVDGRCPFGVRLDRIDLRVFAEVIYGPEVRLTLAGGCLGSEEVLEHRTWADRVDRLTDVPQGGRGWIPPEEWQRWMLAIRGRGKMA